MGIDMSWRYLPGGVCAYGDRARPVIVADLYWSTTPITRDQLDQAGAADLPVTGLDHDQACQVAVLLGGRLPRSVEWEWMAAGSERRRFPWGDADWTPARANLRPSGRHRPTAVGTYPDGATPDGLLDVAGNVWEWTATPSLGSGAVIRGGSYQSLPLYATCRFLNAAPRELRSPGIGLRVVREPTGELVIVGCTRRKAAATRPVPAFLLYQGGLVPALREQLGTGSPWWDRVWFLSARHGLVPARQRLLPYDQPLTPEAAWRLRPVVRRQFDQERARNGPPERLLVICEPSYMDLLSVPGHPLVHHVGDIRGGWPQVAAVLDSWGWR